MTKKEFINTYRNVSADTLRLKFYDKGYPWLEEAITQIECLAKGGKKFNLNGNSVLPENLVSSLSIEQATSAEIADFHGSLINKGDVVLDMTMGLGMDSRAMALAGASKVIGCEINETLADASEKNYTDIKNLEIFNCNSTELLEKVEPDSFNLIFVDPARRDCQGGRVYNLRDCQPDIIELLPMMLSRAPRILAKISPMLDVSRTLSDLPGTHILYVVDDENECKELLADIRRDEQNQPLIIVKSKNKLFAFTKDNESHSELQLAYPETGDILYEPSPGMMKAAPFKLLSNLTTGALNSNTHLYLVSKKTDLPGKFIQISDIFPLSSKGTKEIAKKYPKLNLAVRNFPSTVKDLVKKLKIKEGGEHRAFAVTLADDSKCLIVGKPI